MHTLLPNVLELDRNEKYELALLSFWAYNSIANIIEGVNSSFTYAGRTINLPTGAYEIDDIFKTIQEKLSLSSEKKEYLILRGNFNTLKTEIMSSHPVDFTSNTSVASVLGFDKIILEPNKWYYSTNIVNINQLSLINISCNLVTGVYNDGESSHIIHQFMPTADPGFLIYEKPTPLIYLPLNTHTIQSVHVKVTDQEGNPLDFRSDKIVIRLHIRKVRD